MIRHLSGLAVAVVLATASPAKSAGVPVIDAAQLTQSLQQLKHMASDLNVQIEQVVAMKQQVETQIKQLTNLDHQLKSLIDKAGVSDLFATAKEIQAVAGAFKQPMNTIQGLMSGDFTDVLKDGIDTDVLAALKRVYEGSGFTQEQVQTLGESAIAADRRVARSASASAALSIAGQESHREASASLDRIRQMVELIDEQEGVRAAVDLNTRVTAEIGVILTQMMRLDAASAVSNGQIGVMDAATMAAQRKFSRMSGSTE